MRLMTSLMGIILMFVASLFIMDIVFERIPTCNMNGVDVPGENCMVEYEDYAMFSFYDPTIPEPDRWNQSKVLIMLAQPTIKKVPVTWFAWRVGWKREPVDMWAYQNALPSLGLNNLPSLEPPIKLANGSFAHDIRQLEQVRIK